MPERMQQILTVVAMLSFGLGLMYYSLSRIVQI